MTKIYAITLFCVILCSSPILAASNSQVSSVTGKVVDSKKEGVPFAIVAITAIVNNKAKVIALTPCDENGIFVFIKVPPGEYTLDISNLGYSPAKHTIQIKTGKTQLGDFNLQEGIELDAVQITKKKSLVKTEVDRLIYDVQNDPDVATSSTMQILDKVPFVEIDKMTEKIKVMGREDGFVITVNGKRSLLTSETNQYVTKMLQAGNLKSIELITSPDGKYLNQTAVINFVTESSLPDGFVGTVNTYLNDQVISASSFGLTSKLGKFIYKLDYSYTYSNLYGNKNQASLINYVNSDFKFSDTYSRYSPAPANANTADLSASYDFSQQDLLTIKFSASLKNGKSNLFSHSQYRDADGNPTREFSNTNKNETDNAGYAGSLNYQRSFKDKPTKLFTSTYSFDTKKDQFYYNQLSEAILNHTDYWNETNNDLKNIEHTAAVDFYNTITKNQSYFFTAKYVNRQYGSDTWERDIKLSTEAQTPINALDYTQQVASVKGNYSIRMSKLMLTGEAAFEYTDNDIHFGINNTSLRKKYYTPLAIIRTTYKASDKSNFILSMERRSFRPNIDYLNPYEDQSIAGQIHKGNPNLESSNSYSSMLMYRFFINKKINISTLTRFAYSGNAVQQYSILDNEGMYITTYDNIGKDKLLVLSVSMTINPASWLEVNLGANTWYRTFEYLGIKNSYWQPTYSLRGTSKLWKDAHFNAQIQYTIKNWGRETNIQAVSQPMVVDAMLSISQKIGKHFHSSFSFNNPWQTYLTDINESSSPSFYRYAENTELRRWVGLSLTYTFGRFKENVKSARRGVINSDRNAPQ